MFVRGRTHQDLSEPVRLDLERKVLQGRVVDDFFPGHKLSPFVSNAEQMLLSPNKQLSVSDCNGSAARLADRIRPQHLVLRPCFDYKGVSVVARQQDFAVK